jgi:lipoprotein-releasing system permease protein
VEKILGSGFRVDSRFEQNKTMYMVMNTEKWAVYFILLLVLLIASFNMVGALSMLVLEKQKDLAILRAMGMHPSRIMRVVLAEGVLWSLTGGCTGILLGSTICLIQQKFGVIRIQGSFLVDAYPVRMEAGDLLLVFATIVFVGLLASFYPALRAARPADPSLKSG